MRVKRKTLFFRVWLVSGLLAAAAAVRPQPAERHLYYVGARVCGSCHDGEGMGHQFSLWLLSGHARAYAVLSRPEAREIARLSGVTQEPQASPVCLGCHGTAAEAEKWEKDPTFFPGDGVECEKCHGPGGEYKDAQIMKDRKAAMAAGLRMPTPQDCLQCHAVKGSHAAVHHRPQLDMAKAWKLIAHPLPDAPRFRSPDSDTRESSPTRGPRYAGVEACAQCHDGAQKSYQFSRWRLTAHARAYAVLATPAAYDISRQNGSSLPPQEDPACLKCHTTASDARPGARLPSYSPAEGVGCEACHGAGSEYAVEAVMLDRAAAYAAGLQRAPKATCAACHEKAHGKPFDVESAWAKIEHANRPLQGAAQAPYKNPLRMAFSPDGRKLFVTCEASGTVAVVDTETRRKESEIPVGRQPNDIAFSPDGGRAFVTNRLDDTVTVIDVRAGRAIRTIAAGDEPHGIRTDAAGTHLYVLNTLEDSISVIETATGAETKRLSASRGPWAAALSPDGRQLLVTNCLSRFVDFRTSSLSEITVLDAQRGVVTDRWLVPGANYLQGIAWHPSGEFAFFTLLRTKNVIPMTRVVQGWTVTNGLGIAWKDGRVHQVLLDEPNLYFPDPTDVAFTPDGNRALVTSSGSDRVAVIDVPKLLSMLRNAAPEELDAVFPNHLGKAPEFVIRHIPTGDSPRGILVAPDGKVAFTANCLDDSLTVIDLERLESAGRIDLGGPKEISKVRIGERLFHSARITFQRQFSCHSCHPDGHINGLAFDIEPDGIGVSPVDNRTLRGILDTAPFKWEGTNPSLAHECGPRLAVFFTRIQPFTPDQLSALVEYIASIPRPPNRYRPVGADLTAAQRRGREIFYRTRTNTGEVIPEGNRCYVCHSGPMYTDRRIHNVGTQMQYDRTGEFETPHLNNIYDSAPYLHNGIARTLEEIWTRFNPHDRHGVTNDMTKDQLNDLIEFLKTL